MTRPTRLRKITAKYELNYFVNTPIYINNYKDIHQHVLDMYYVFLVLGGIKN